MCAPKRKQRKTYDARVEFLAVQTDVAKMMAAGHRIKAVFERLTTDGRITVSYTTFCDYVRRREPVPEEGPEAGPGGLCPGPAAAAISQHPPAHSRGPARKKRAIFPRQGRGHQRPGVRFTAALLLVRFYEIYQADHHFYEPKRGKAVQINGNWNESAFFGNCRKNAESRRLPQKNAADQMAGYGYSLD